MNAETIKDFLVSLGFQVDDAGAKKFDSVLAGVTANVFKTAGAVEAAAGTVMLFTTKIAAGLDNLYWASQRTGASVAGIKALGYAASQTGSSAEAARGSLESLSRFMRNNPGAEGFLNRLGVQTRDASGNMRDMASIFTGVGQKLSTMPYYRANQYAQMLGIDENTLMAMRRGVGQFSAQYSQMAKAIGYNADQAAVSSNRFMTSLRSFGQMAGMVRDKIGSNLADGLTGAIDNLRKQILDNFPKIEGTITRGVNSLLWLAGVIGQVIYRLIQAAGDIREWWNTLGQGTQKLIETLGGLVIAWRVLNSAFLASPIGIITSLAGAILLLYDDYKTWREGGKSLIDWEKWKPGIDAAKTALDWFTDKLNELNSETITWKGTLKGLSDFIKGDWSKSIDQAVSYVNQKFNGFFADFGRKLANSPFWSIMKKLHIITDKDTDDMQNFFSGNSSEGEQPEQHGQSARYPKGIRNNNAGNLRYVGQAGAVNDGTGFARFSSAYDGLKAMAKQLMRYSRRGINTISGIINTWAPSSENNTRAYIQAISKTLGMAPDAVLNMSDPRVLSALMGGIVQHENGRNPYTRELVGQAARAITGAPTLHQETNIYVQGVSDPREAGNIVADKQNAVNSNATQQLTRRNY
ncbi:lytic transglycosylase domain-containing protein [Rouxiella badensis]|uniref:lytic transglycosylase domain-containing protein n=1 Tax=Rouxiella badensis TaxID=1646377 RepID=UPI001D136D52|nr:lytic transglycosylase domain-containing protein [Rouxiella badensis]MCC3717980.1 lytic transglycosylase domain-containing protein [Rouxiella badensis]MCC3730005.1 lytic transglycosylase domain-containing protein [Rouxiella badensis]